MREKPRGADLVRAWLILLKVKVSLLAALSGVMGFVLCAPRLSGRLVACAAGIFLLACGAGALNEYQEREVDSRLDRTRDRPLVTGRLKPGPALLVSAVLMALGLSVLAIVGPAAALLGAFAVAWYNGVYTRLKAVTPFAALPGAVVGAVPPAIGWLSGGGRIADAGCLGLCLFYFMWQVPHFWLVVLDHGKDYRSSGLPAIVGSFSDGQVRSLISVWILGTAVCSLVVFPAAATNMPLARDALLILCLWLAGLGLRFQAGKPRQAAALFRQMNYFIVSAFLILCLGRFLGVVLP